MPLNLQKMQALRNTFDFNEIIGKSPALRKTLEIVSQVADTHSNILIQGESGTGKELVARALHLNSSRRNKPFIIVNSGAIPESLLESELFGYKPGAFTGAKHSKPGKFELADGGTLFLDEIGDMSPFLQCKILRAVQNYQIERLGGTHAISVDVRILAATNRDLRELIKKGMFRQDLYYRLNIMRINLPPLRERIEDIPLLAYYFLKRYNKREQKEIHNISLEALEILQTYHWPGNIRELENVIERSVILCHDKTIAVQHLPREIIGAGTVPLVDYQNFHAAVKEFKKLLIIRTLQQTKNKAEAARRLRLNRTYFFKLLHQLGIE